MLEHGFAFDFGRLSALYRYGVLDADPDPQFERIAEELRAALTVPSVQIVLVDDQRLCVMAAAGSLAGEIRKQGSLSALAIEQPDLLVIDDVERHAQGMEARLSFGDTIIRAYAAAQLRTRDNHAVGVIYAADRRAREFTLEQQRRIDHAASMVMAALEQRLESRLDANSGAMTPSAFAEMVSRVGALAARHRSDMSLLVIDIDPFHAHLESFKADLGRLVIERMSALGRAHVRRLDSFGRLSESVFAVLLPETNAAGARSLSQRLISELANGWSSAVLGSGRTPIGIGQSSLRSGPCQPSELITKALEASRIEKTDPMPSKSRNPSKVA